MNTQIKWPEPKDGGYDKIDTITAADPWVTGNYTRHTRTFTVVVKPHSVYILLAVHDQGACAYLWSFLMNYNVCPAFTHPTTHVQLPRTVAPANESFAIKVNGSCSQNGTESSNTSLYSYCESNGKWNRTLQQGKCLCKAGFTNIGLECKGKLRCLIFLASYQSNYCFNPCPVLNSPNLL